jgi:hypothetical protein
MSDRMVKKKNLDEKLIAKYLIDDNQTLMANIWPLESCAPRQVAFIAR